MLRWKCLSLSLSSGLCILTGPGDRTRGWWFDFWGVFFHLLYKALSYNVYGPRTDTNHGMARSCVKRGGWQRAFLPLLYPGQAASPRLIQSKHTGQWGSKMWGAWSSTHLSNGWVCGERLPHLPQPVGSWYTQPGLDFIGFCAHCGFLPKMRNLF